MLNPDFYPTPAAVIAQMVEPFMCEAGRGYQRFLYRAGKTVLDPSAGSGAILDYVSEQLSRGDAHGYGSRREQGLYCCENDPELKAALQGKEYRLLGDDFLSYCGDMIFDVILMNPPFSAGDKHVLHAYQTVGHGGHVVALVNSETIRNPYTETRRQLARLIADFGSVEHLGPVFRQAERSTGVEVSLIRLQKPEVGNPFAFEWENVSREGSPDLSEETFKSQVATRDVIGNMITQFDQLKAQFMNLLRAVDGIAFYGRGLVKNGEYRDAWKIAQECLTESRRGEHKGYAKGYVSFAEAMRQEIWGVVLEKINIQKFMTHKVRENFTQFARQQGYLDFTHENVGQLVQLVLDNTAMILEQAVGDVFDMFTMYYKENRCHVEGWKTNDRYKVNRKIILPYWVQLSEYCQDFSLSHSRWSEYSDIDKVMCYLTGTNFDHCHTVAQALESKFRRLGRVDSGSFDGTCESAFFRLRFFKKGTLHLEFKDERLWQEFNLRACAGKLWLPEPEMKAYRARTRSPFDPAPAAGGQQRPLLGQQAEEGQQLTLALAA